jgi:prepilin-type N-terminal cleavage/methylation domain-containing protein/prepilin-type processing-associated H-X9-DG protein
MSYIVSTAARRRSASRDGFTLVELLVVIGVIAVLIAMLLPALNRARASANNVKCMSNLRQQALAFIAYAAEYKGTLPPSYRGGPEYQAVAYPILLERKYLSSEPVDQVPNVWNNAEVFTVRRSGVLECPNASRDFVSLTNGTWVNGIEQRDGSRISGWVFRTGGGDYWTARSSAYGMPGTFTHYQINGAWGWHVVHYNLHSRLPFTISEPWWPWYAPVPIPEGAGKISFRGAGGMWMAGDSASDFGLIRPVFRHGTDAAPLANFAYMDGHVETLSPKDIKHRLMPGSVDTMVDDPRLWKREPAVP